MSELLLWYDSKHFCMCFLFAGFRHAKVLEALTFCSEICNCERFVPILRGLSIGDSQMKVCLVVYIYIYNNLF